MPGIARNRLTLTMRTSDGNIASHHVQNAADVVRQTPALLLDVIRAHRNELASLHGTLKVDVRLTNEGREAAFARAAADIAARSSAQVLQIRARAENAMSLLETAIDDAVIEPVPGAEGILGRQAWWARAKEMMAAGITLPTIIDEATDPELLNAIFDEYPTWARINFKNLRPEQNQERLEGYALRIEKRFAELAGDGPLGANARMALSVRPDMVALPITLDTATEAAASTDPSRGPDLGTAMSARLAKAQAAAAMNVVDEGQVPRSRRTYDV